MVAQRPPATPHRQSRDHLDRGAAAVEMALILPVLLFLLMGMIDFGRAYNAQIQLSQASREGARLASLNLAANSSDANYGSAAITARVKSAAAGLNPTGVTATPTYCPVPASASDSATVVASSSFTWITGISAISGFFGPGTFPNPTTLQSTGVMRCAG